MIANFSIFVVFTLLAQTSYAFISTRRSNPGTLDVLQGLSNHNDESTNQDAQNDVLKGDSQAPASFQGETTEVQGNQFSNLCYCKRPLNKKCKTLCSGGLVSNITSTTTSTKEVIQHVDENHQDQNGTESRNKSHPGTVSSKPSTFDSVASSTETSSSRAPNGANPESLPVTVPSEPTAFVSVVSSTETSSSRVPNGVNPESLPVTVPSEPTALDSVINSSEMSPSPVLSGASGLSKTFIGAFIVFVVLLTSIFIFFQWAKRSRHLRLRNRYMIYGLCCEDPPLTLNDVFDHDD